MGRRNADPVLLLLCGLDAFRREEPGEAAFYFEFFDVPEKPAVVLGPVLFRLGQRRLAGFRALGDQHIDMAMRHGPRVEMRIAEAHHEATTDEAVLLLRPLEELEGFAVRSTESVVARHHVALGDDQERELCSFDGEVALLEVPSIGLHGRPIFHMSRIAERTETLGLRNSAERRA